MAKQSVGEGKQPPSLPDEEALDYLAKVLVEAYFKQKKYERTGNAS